jgi:cytochrome c biogenesis protein CcmG, thiol:disulfide interchange protein DsbE
MTEYIASRSRLIFAAVPLIIFLALAVIFFRQMSSGIDVREIPSVLIGQPAPQFNLQDLEGLNSADGPVPGFSSDTLKGRVSVVNVWASWCAPCRTEHPIIMEIARDERFQVLGLNYKDQNENALRFLGQLGNPFDAVGVDPRGKAAIDWGVYGVPESFIVDAEGIVRYKHVGPLTPQTYQSRFLPELEQALAQQ